MEQLLQSVEEYMASAKQLIDYHKSIEGHQLGEQDQSLADPALEYLDRTARLIKIQTEAVVEQAFPEPFVPLIEGENWPKRLVEDTQKVVTSLQSNQTLADLSIQKDLTATIKDIPAMMAWVGRLSDTDDVLYQQLADLVDRFLEVTYQRCLYDENIAPRNTVDIASGIFDLECMTKLRGTYEESFIEFDETWAIEQYVTRGKLPRGEQEEDFIGSIPIRVQLSIATVQQAVDEKPDMPTWKRHQALRACNYYAFACSRYMQSIGHDGSWYQRPDNHTIISGRLPGEAPFEDDDIAFMETVTLGNVSSPRQLGEANELSSSSNNLDTTR